MIVKASVLESLRVGFVGIFKKAFSSAPSQWEKVAIRIKSSGKENAYGWLSKFPQMREWVGDRVLKSIKESAYTLPNKKFEASIGVDRTDIEDDNLGMYNGMFQSMGQEAVEHVDRNIFGLLKAGFTSLCYDGQNFFDTDHPINAENDGSGADVSFSNIVNPLVTDKPAWFLLDTSKPVKPLIFQERTTAELDAITDIKNDTVFMKDEYMFGVRARRAFGFGLWQQAIGCRDALNEVNFDKAFTQMMTVTRDGGSKMGLMPTVLVVSPENRAAAKALIETERKANGASNPNYKAVEVLVCRWL